MIWFVIQMQNWLVKHSETRQILKDFTALNQINTWNIVYKDNFLLDVGEGKLGPWNKFEIDVLNYYCNLVITVHCLSLSWRRALLPPPFPGWWYWESDQKPHLAPVAGWSNDHALCSSMTSSAFTELVCSLLWVGVWSLFPSTSGINHELLEQPIDRGTWRAHPR